MRADDVRVRVRHERRKSLAMRVTPGGVEVAIPETLSADSPEVAAFIEEGLARLHPPEPLPAGERPDREELRALVDRWAAKLGVTVERVQLRRMRNKWGSMSTRGTLTLADDLLRLPRRLAEYVIGHELLHLRIPKHDGAFRLVLSRHMPDWVEREQELGRWVLKLSECAPVSRRGE